MLKSRRAVLVAAMLVLAGAGTAWADSCFRDVNNNVIVGKGFTLPGAGVCHPFNGYFVELGGIVLSGTACGTSDNSTIRFSLQYNTPPGPAPFLAYAVAGLSRSTLTGSIQFCPVGPSGGGCTPLFALTKIACPASRVLD